MTVRASINLNSGGIPQASRLVLSMFPRARPVAGQNNAYQLPDGAGRALANFAGPMFILDDGLAGQAAHRTVKHYADTHNLDYRVA